MREEAIMALEKLRVMWHRLRDFDCHIVFLFARPECLVCFAFKEPSDELNRAKLTRKNVEPEEKVNTQRG